MIFIVRGPEGQRRVEVDEKEALGTQLCSSFGVNELAVSLDGADKNELDQAQTPESLGLRNGQVIYVQYEKVTEPKEERVDNTIKRDVVECKHDPNTMCSNCAPLDPWDERYHRDKMIKYLSFGSYHEMLRSKNKDLVVEDYSEKVCADHGSNTKCSKCQERNIILAPQVFRMVDHIEFDNQDLVENFIKNWRDSRRQRFGLLIGKYMKYDKVPLGVKVVVSGIWEPEQEDFPDGFVISESMDDFFSGTGLETVGIMYTDIQMDKGITTSDKILKDYFLSSLEIQFMAKMQLMYPYFIQEKEQKIEFNSRFVSVVVTADKEGNIELQEYQVSGQCMGLVRSDYILPTEDPKKFLTTKDIVYRTGEKESMIKADPYLPGDFFLVRLTHGCKHNPLFKNTEFMPKKLTSKKIAEYLKGDLSIHKFSNFSFLTKIRKSFSDWLRLFKCIMEQDEREFERIKECEDFKSFLCGIGKYRPSTWTCQACTFLNERNMAACEVCGTERS